METPGWALQHTAPPPCAHLALHGCTPHPAYQGFRVLDGELALEGIQGPSACEGPAGAASSAGLEGGSPASPESPYLGEPSPFTSFLPRHGPRIQSA